jgi:hypothetical protein
MSLHKKNWKVRMALVSMGNLDSSTMPYWPGSNSTDGKAQGAGGEELGTLGTGSSTHTQGTGSSTHTLGTGSSLHTREGSWQRCSMHLPQIGMTPQIIHAGSQVSVVSLPGWLPKPKQS